MRREKQRGLVAAACFLLSALLLYLSLSAQIRLWDMQRELSALEREREALKREKAILTVRLVERTDLEELERRAEDEFGLRRCRPDQITELGIDDGDDAYR